MKKIKARNIRIRNQKLVKWAIVFILGIFGLRYGSYVNAGMNDSTIDKKRMDGIYAIADVNGTTRIFYLNMYEMNGRVAYCIDLGVDITTSVYHSTTDFSVSYLKEEQIDYIRSISYFGYGYEGHDDYRYFMAAQELIWEYLSGKNNVEWSNQMDVNGTRINIDTYKKKILQLRDSYNKKLSFDWIDGVEYTVGEKVVLTDKNGILSNYEVSSKYSDVSIDGSNLVIKVGNVIGTDMIELKRKGYYSYDSLLYYYEGSQKLISNGNYKDVELQLKFNIKGVTVKGQVVNKKNGSNIPYGQATLEGAVYELYNENRELVGTFESGKKGFFEINNLPFGTYYVKQIKASEGYLINEEEVQFELNEGNYQLILKQDVIAINLEIRKVYGHDGIYKPEKDILFFLYDNNGNMYGNLNTNQYGAISLWLAYGSYTLHQWSTTYGYSKVDDIKIEVKEPKDGYVYYNLVNELILAKVKVNTLEKESGENLSLEGISYRIRKKDESTYLEIDGIDIFTTNSNGEVVIPVLLSYGDYVLEQVDTPNGVMLNKQKQDFRIDDKSNLALVDDNFVMEVNVYNELVKGKVEVLANEEKFYTEFNDYGYEKIARSDREFSLIAGEDIVVNDNVIYQKEEIIYNKKTDNDGKLIIDNLYLGSYCLIDKETGKEACFVLESLDNKTKVVEKDLEFTKKLNKGNIIIQNVSNKGENISESVFEILDKDGLVIYTGITNDEGIIKVENILSDDYCIRQKKVSSDYQNSEEEICFTLEDEKKIAFINNLIIKEVVKVPDTLLESIGFYEALLFLVVIGTGILVYKKIFASKLYR